MEEFSGQNQVGEKRFRVGQEGFVKERLEALKATVAELKHEDPNVLSLCVFGSTVKGRARERSDIDGYLFIQTDPADAARIQTTRDETGVSTTFRMEEAGRLKEDFLHRMQKKAPFSEEQVNGIKFRPINSEIVRDHLSTFLAQKEALDSFEKLHEAWVSELSSDILDDPQQLAVYKEREPVRPEHPEPSSTLTGMFHLDVGGGIREYRTELIKSLEKLGEAGEKAWRDIIDSVQMMEQDMELREEIRYPRSLSEARRVYIKP